jgi:hypothetical protein
VYALATTSILGATMAHRVQFDFSDDAYERLIKIRAAAGATSNAEAVRDALSVYEWFIRQTKEGNSIKVISPSGQEKVVEFLR